MSIGKLHFRSSDDDNGFTEEILPMHVIEGKGDLGGDRMIWTISLKIETKYLHCAYKQEGYEIEGKMARILTPMRIISA